MSAVRDLYRTNLALLTDLYELTMGAGYLEAGVADREAVFSLSFRDLPFDGGYAVAAGLDDALEILGAPAIRTGRHRLPARPVAEPPVDRSSARASSTGWRPSNSPATSTPSRRAPSSSPTSPSSECVARSCRPSSSRACSSPSSASRRSWPRRRRGSSRPPAARRSWSSACAAPRDRTAHSRPRALRTSAEWRPLPTFSRAGCSGFRCAARTPIRGSRSSTTSNAPSTRTPTLNPTTSPCWWIRTRRSPE